MLLIWEQFCSDFVELSFGNYSVNYPQASLYCANVRHRTGSGVAPLEEEGDGSHHCRQAAGMQGWGVATAKLAIFHEEDDPWVTNSVAGRLLRWIPGCCLRGLTELRVAK